MSMTKRYGSASKARAAVKGGGGGSDILRRIKGDETLKVRFLQQPEDWHEAYYHFVADKFQWCTQKKSCSACTDGISRSKVALANALLVKENKVVIVQMTTSLANEVLKRFNKFGETVMDRDYDLVREGTTKNDTRYSADYDPPKKRDLTRYTLHDIEEVVFGDHGGDDEDEPEDEVPRSTKRRNVKTSPRSRDDDYEDEEEEDYDEDEEDEDEEEAEDQYADLTRAELKSEIKKYDPEFVAKKSQTDEDILDILRELVAEYGHPDEDDEEDEPEDEVPSGYKKRPAAKSRNTKYDGLDEFRPKKKAAPAASRKTNIARRPR